MGRIEWIEIEHFPDELRGKLLLLAMAGDGEPALGRWTNGRWIDDYGDDLETASSFVPTHFAEINPPTWIPAGFIVPPIEEEGR